MTEKQRAYFELMKEHNPNWDPRVIDISKYSQMALGRDNTILATDPHDAIMRFFDLPRPLNFGDKAKDLDWSNVNETHASLGGIPSNYAINRIEGKRTSVSYEFSIESSSEANSETLPTGRQVPIDPQANFAEFWRPPNENDEMLVDEVVVSRERTIHNNFSLRAINVDYTDIDPDISLEIPDDATPGTQRRIRAPYIQERKQQIADELGYHPSQPDRKSKVWFRPSDQPYDYWADYWDRQAYLQETWKDLQRENFSGLSPTPGAKRRYKQKHGRHYKKPSFNSKRKKFYDHYEPF